MRVDVLTIFPDYLAPLDLSLVGKARRDGLLDVAVHDLRAWTTDRHRTVDDTPVGGGAGMVMRPDVWGEALDEVLMRPLDDTGAAQEARDTTGAGVRPRRVLLVPTPSGLPLTQRDVERWAAGADQLVIACGRYEGIDARVVEEYRARAGGELEVREFSLGDYVLNGGEVAALVVIEGVARLLPGVVGNPQSLVEESHGAAGLLEYPVHTRPVSWRGRDVPPDLLSGDHARIARWRRDRALERTAERRPDMIRALDASALDRADRTTLLRLGWLSADALPPTRVTIEAAAAADAPALAALAAVTFPLACPPQMPREAIAQFVAANLSEERFTQYLADPARYSVIVARTEDDRLAGYTLSELPRTPEEGPGAPDVAAMIPHRPVVYLSKLYVRPDLIGSALAWGLLERTFAVTTEPFERDGQVITPAGMYLGTNAANRRALRFYRKNGFTVVGARRFDVGGLEQDDRALWRPAAH